MRGLVGILVMALTLSGAAADEKRDDAAHEMARGDEYFKAKDYVAAIAHYNAAKLLAPDRPGPQLALGIAYAAVDNCKQAIPAMEEYLKLKSADQDADARLVIDACKQQLAGAPARGCNSGMVKTADGHCCWPGQSWAADKNKCAGAPSACPAPRVIVGEACQFDFKRSPPVPPPPVFVAGTPPPTSLPPQDDPEGRVYSRGTIQQNMVANKHNVVACARQFHLRGDVTAQVTVNGLGVVTDVQLSPPVGGTEAGSCLVNAIRLAHFPRFTGPPRSFSWPFRFNAP